MIKTYIETKYYLEDIPDLKTGLPFGHGTYNDLYKHFESLDDLTSTINILIGSLKNTLQKYDRPYELEHKAMCDEMKQLKKYCENKLKEIEKLTDK